MAERALPYRVEGQGPPMLLVHGFAISYNIWQKLLPLLRRHFTLVMVVLPGSGESPLPAEGQDYLTAAVEGIEEVRRELRLEKWDVLGYSSGSRVAEAYVQTHTAQVCRAIFLCPVEVHGPKAASLRLAMAVDRWVPAFGSLMLSGWRLKSLISFFGFNLQRDPLCEEWYAEIGAAPMRTLKETIRLVERKAGESFSVPVPFDLIWADKDFVPSMPRIRGPRDHMVHGQHAAPMEAAEEVAKTILALSKEP
jgi:pimeloyl-ACP methyl ester carboxylesterase